MIPAYPSPCDTCTRKSCGDVKGIGCSQWIKRYRYRQKQINAYAKQAYSTEPSGMGTKTTTHFVYPHPDDTRRYLRHRPCDSCKMDATCDTPCRIYLRWWDARMEWLKIKFTEAT